MTASRLVHLMRHGTPAVEGLLLGRTDAPVTDMGVAACTRRAAGIDVRHVVASDLQRARRCASAIAAPLGLAVMVDPRWRELDFGDWDGCAPASIDPAALGNFYDDPETAAPPRGERWSALCARVADAVAALPDEPALVVTHGGAMRAVLANACGFDRRQVWAFDLPYAAMLSLRIWSGPQPTVQIVGLST